MRILYVINSVSGGTGVNLCNVANRLVGRNEISICEVSPQAASMRDRLHTDVRLFSLAAGKKDLRSWREFVRLARRLRPDVIHALDFIGQFFALAGRFVAGGAVIASIQGLVGGFSGWRRAVEHVALRRVDRVHCISQAGKDKVEAVFGLAGRRIAVIHNGIEVDRFRPPATSSGTARGGWRIGCIANFYLRLKGQHHLIEAFALVLERLPEAELWLVGEGVFLPDCKQLAERLGVAGRVHFLGDRQDIPQLLWQLDVFVMPSLSEAFGIALIEAMAAGVPAVASRVGGIPEIVDDGQTGLLVPAGDPQALAAAVLRYREDESERRAIARRGQKSIEERFTIDRIAQGYEDLYRDTVSAEG